MTARTPQKIAEAYQKAVEASRQDASLPALSPATSKAIKGAIAAGRLRPGGLQVPKSLFTDSRRSAGNPLQNEKTYYYKVAVLDLCGQEQPLDTAPVVAGIPKDLDPPRVPGQPLLKAEADLRAGLKASQAAHLKDPKTARVIPDAASTALKPVTSLPLIQAHAPQTASQVPSLAPASKPSAAGISASETTHKQLAARATSVSVAALRMLGEASIIRSNPDGTVPPAQLVWAGSPDADLAGYLVHKAVGNGPMAKVAETTSPQWTDTALEPGKAYRYAVAAVDKLGNVSALSPTGKVEVSDSGLPGRLVVSQMKGQATPTPPLELPGRTFIRPGTPFPTSGSLNPAKTKLKVSKSDAMIHPEFVEPKQVKAPRIQPAAAKTTMSTLSLAKAPAAPLASETSASKLAPVSPAAKLTLEPSAVKLVPGSSAAKLDIAMPATFHTVKRSINPMLVAPLPSKEIYVVLEWGKPIPGATVEYELQQAPQRMEIEHLTRPPVAFQPAITAFDPGEKAAAVPALKPQASVNPGLDPAAAKMLTSPGKTSEAPSVHVMSTQSVHTGAAKNVIATQGQGLRVSDTLKNQMASLVPKDGPGTFSKVNQEPITKERYVVSFPAEVAQYGGATFYYKFQASTKEFGRRIEGPVSAPIEVRLPDIVPPPSPVPGSIDLQQNSTGTLDVVLTWAQAKVPDLAGVVVERQPMNFKLVDGEAKATGPAGPLERITSEPWKGLAYRDKEAPGGLMRYTLRSVDETGNLSSPAGTLDILVPSEPVPAAPPSLAVSGDRLTWAAAPRAAGYTVWNSFTGKEEDYVCISGILGADATSFQLPPEGVLHLRVVARSVSGMNTASSTPIVRTP